MLIYRLLKSDIAPHSSSNDTIQDAIGHMLSDPLTISCARKMCLALLQLLRKISGISLTIRTWHRICLAKPLFSVLILNIGSNIPNMHNQSPKTFRLALLPLILIVLFGQLPAQTESGTLDTSILDERSSLWGFLSSSQRIRFSRAEERVEEGESALRRGEFMVNRKPSKLNPDEDLTETKARGRRLIEGGRSKIRQGKAEMVKILQAAKAEKAASAPPDEVHYNYSIDVAESYESALEETASVILETCWDAGYNQIFFDRVFKSNAEGTVKGTTSINNLTYETLIEIDGTRFSLKLPTNFRLDLKASDAGRRFTFDNPDDYAEKRIALLSIEVIEFDRQTNGSESDDASSNGDVEEPPEKPIQLFVAQGIDIETLQLIHQELLWIVPEGVTAPDLFVEDKMTLTERKQMIQTLASLPEPYKFRVESDVNDRSLAMMLEAYLGGALLKHFSLEFVPVNSLRRTYADSRRASFEEVANARFVLQQDEKNEARFGLSAFADKADRSLPIGWLEISED